MPSGNPSSHPPVRENAGVIRQAVPPALIWMPDTFRKGGTLPDFPSTRWAGTSGMSGQSPAAASRGRTSRCSRRSWRNPASWREAPLAARCWTPLWAAVQPALWRNAWAGVLSGSTYPRTTAPWPRNEFRTQRRWCEWEAETGSWTRALFLDNLRRNTQ